MGKNVSSLETKQKWWSLAITLNTLPSDNKIGKYLDWPFKGHICTLHISALKKKYQGRAETSRSQDGQSQTRHTRNDESGLNPQRDSRPTREGREQDDGPERLSPQYSQRNLDKETLVDSVTRSQQEAKCWERLENDAAKRHRKALDCVIQAAEEVVEHAKNNNLDRKSVV